MNQDQPSGGRQAVLIASLSLNPIAVAIAYDGPPPEAVANADWPHDTDERGRQVYRNVTHDPSTYFTLPAAGGFTFTAEPAPNGTEAALLLFNDTDDNLIVSADGDETPDVLLPGDLRRRLPADRHALQVVPQSAADGAPTVTRPRWLPVPGNAYALRYACGCEDGKAFLFELTSVFKRFPDDAKEMTANPWQLNTDDHLREHAATRTQAAPESRHPSLEKAFAAIDAYYRTTRQAFLKERRDLFQRHLSHHLDWMQHRKEFLDHVERVSWAA